MEEQLYLSSLYDYYQPLLTDKQSKYFEEYYFDNLSLTELSENHGVSRNAIHKSIKETEEKLKEYEAKLHLVEKNNQIKKIIASCDENVQQEILKKL